jgi:Uma2 family endonuclease
MATAALKRAGTDDHRIFFNASWDEYLSIARAIGDQHVRLAYDGERVELMSPGAEHEDLAGMAEAMVRVFGSVLGIPLKSVRTTRWERPDVSRALEADATFFFNAEKIAVAVRRPRKTSDWPIPDLAIEIDTSPSQIDRPGIYAALRVTEIWRFDGETLRIDRLNPDGTYSEVTESGWLGVRPEEIAHLLSLPHKDDNDFLDQVREWAFNVLLPRQAGRREGGEAVEARP